MKSLLASLMLAASIGLASAAMSRPTLVIFLSDDHGQLDSTPYGATDVRTPNMQRLADAGLTFTRAFIASPACAPSRAAMLTGLMPARNGAEANHSYKREGIPSLTENLKALGYELAAFGKVAHGNDTGRHGFDHIDAAHDDARVKAYLDQRDTSRPLCLFVGTHDPHVPWLKNEGYDPAKVYLPPTFVDTPETREFRARYYTDVTTADRELGELYDLAREKFDPRQTLFIYTSDHGGQWPFGKWNLYDAGICVPFLAVWDGVIKPGQRTDAMVQWIDLLPTLIQAAGGRAPVGVDGRSFLTVLRGESKTHRDVIFTTHSGDGRMNVYPIRSLRTGDWKYIHNLHPEFAHTTHIDKALAKDGGLYWTSWYEAYRNDHGAAVKVKRYHERSAEELYDLKADPYELRNLAADPAQAGRLKEMGARLDDWMKSQGDTAQVFNEPRLLSDPASTRPGPDAGTDAPKNPKRKKR